MQDVQGNKYIKKYPAAIEGTPTYGGVSEVMAEVLLKLVGAKPPEIYIQSDNKKNTYKAMYSKVVPGESVEEVLKSNEKVKNIFLVKSQKTRIINPNAMLLRMGGALEIAVRHPDLARIYAFDIFANNSDRHAGNLFYDVKTDSFTPIDNEGAMSSSINDPNNFQQAVTNGFRYLLSKKDLSDTEKQGLQVFADSLKSLASIDPNELSKTYEDLYNSNKRPLEDDTNDIRTKAIKDNSSFVNTLLKDFEKDFIKHGIKM